ncbi:MAG: hypothetical protein C0616_08240 [Desulfuromonas sp.]|nr:MAG: hypothetical protein C0616_08240 [Desulfuromonas sp.]
MLIGVVSDTHFQSVESGLAWLQAMQENDFSEVELILHAGDLVATGLLDFFVEKPMLAVRGNCDAYHPDLPQKRILTLAGFRIGMMHGYGAGERVLSCALQEFAEENLDVLVYGHSHQSLCEIVDGVLCLNPGSPTDRRFAPYHSVGLLELGERATGRIVNLDATDSGPRFRTGMTA